MCFNLSDGFSIDGCVSASRVFRITGHSTGAKTARALPIRHLIPLLPLAHGSSALWFGV